MNGSHRRRCAAQADQEHLTARTGYNSLPLRVSRWLGRYSEARKPRSKGGARAHRHKARDESKGQPIPTPGRRATEKHSMEYPKRLVEAEAKTKSAFRKEKHARRMSGGAPPSPNQALKSQRDTPGRVTNWTGPPHHKKLRKKRKNSGKRKEPALQSKNRKDRCTIRNGRDGQTPTQRQGDIHANRKGRCQEQRPDCCARNQKPLASLPCVEDQCMKTPR